MRLLFGIVSTMILVLLLSSCNKDEGPFLLGKELILEPGDTASYALHIQPVFNEHCITCHDSFHSKLDLQSFVSYDELLYSGFNASYVDTINPKNSRVYRHIIGTYALMPPLGELSDSDIGLILLWIEQGALNN